MKSPHPGGIPSFALADYRPAFAPGLSAIARCTAGPRGFSRDAERLSGPGPNSDCQTTQQQNALFKNPPDEIPEYIEVTDPAHPLFGRRFPVLSISHPPQRPGHVFVAYRDGMRLRIPVSATNLATDHISCLRTQFTREALRALLALLKECEDLCPAYPGDSGTGSPKP